jgi:hypothetical protein
VCRSKHVEPSVNFGIINSITKLHLVGISTELSTMHRSVNIKSSVFLTTSSHNDDMYCECSGGMFNSLNKSRHDTLLPAIVIILIALFCNLKILLL